MTGGSEDVIDSVAVEHQVYARPRALTGRKSSFSEAFSKPFARRRTATLLHSSTSSTTLHPSSRIPTPSGIPRSNSFFSNLGPFTSKSTAANPSNETSELSTPNKRSRKISDRLAQTPFFSSQGRFNYTPVINKQKRETSVQIEQRGLMAPLHPPLPRSSTVGNLAQGHNVQSSPQTPNFMRSTSSSARRSSIVTPKQPVLPLPTIASCKTPTSQRHIPSSETPCYSKTPTDQRHLPPSDIVASLATDEVYHPTDRRRRLENEDRTPSSEHPPRKSSLAHAPIKSSMQSHRIRRNHERSITPTTPIGGGHSNSNDLPVPEPPRSVIGGTNLATFDKHEIYQANTRASGPQHRGDDHSEDDDDYAEHSVLCQGKTPTVVETECSRTSSSDMSDPRLIHTALPTLTWAGRFQSLTDRFRTAVLPSSPTPNSNTSSSPPSTTSSPNSSITDPMHSEIRRTRRVYAHLESLCTTQEARESLAEFKLFMEERERMGGGGVKGAKVKEKQGWLQGLMKGKKGEGGGK